MRALLRALIATVFLFLVLFVSLLGFHHDDWHNHVDDFKKKIPQAGKVLPPALTKYIPPAFQAKPAAQPLEYGSLPWLGKVELEPMPYPSESEKALVMAKLSSEDTDWVQQELPEYGISPSPLEKGMKWLTVRQMESVHLHCRRSRSSAAHVAKQGTRSFGIFDLHH